MAKGAWWATVHGVTESGMTGLLTLSAFAEVILTPAL